jgi:ATP-dependent Clp protease ATP-binding subunit ClpC
MDERINRFTEQARRVLRFAHAEAQGYRQPVIEPELLLLGLLDEYDGTAAKILERLGINLTRARDAVEATMERGKDAIREPIGLTSRSKRVIELAVDEARLAGHTHIGTPHVLLGLAREGESISEGVLERLGLTLDGVRTQTLQVLRDTQGAQDARGG